MFCYKALTLLVSAAAVECCVCDLKWGRVQFKVISEEDKTKATILLQRCRLALSWQNYETWWRDDVIYSLMENINGPKCQPCGTTSKDIPLKSHSPGSVQYHQVAVVLIFCLFLHLFFVFCFFAPFSLLPLVTLNLLCGCLHSHPADKPLLPPVPPSPPPPAPPPPPFF